MFFSVISTCSITSFFAFDISTVPPPEALGSMLPSPTPYGPFAYCVNETVASMGKVLKSAEVIKLLGSWDFNGKEKE